MGAKIKDNKTSSNQQCLNKKSHTNAINSNNKATSTILPAGSSKDVLDASCHVSKKSSASSYVTSSQNTTKKSSPKDIASSKQEKPENSTNSDKATLHTNTSECHICVEPEKYTAILSCGHRLCHLCYLRVRILYGIKECMFCKSNVQMAWIGPPEKCDPQDNSPKSTPFFDKENEIHYDSKQIQEECKRLLKLNCPLKQCSYTGKDWKALKAHAEAAHQRIFCDVCVEHQKIFSFEHRLYTKKSIEKHYFPPKEKDNEQQLTDITTPSVAQQTFKGHPQCKFCKILLYDEDDLHRHCRDHHERCHICDQVSRRPMHLYFKNYDHLERHFRSEHFLCPYEECLEQKFVVFANSIDLRAHEIEKHSNKHSNSKSLRNVTDQIRFLPLRSANRGLSESSDRSRANINNNARASSSNGQNDDDDFRNYESSTSQSIELTDDFPELPSTSSNRVHKFIHRNMARNTQNLNPQARYQLQFPSLSRQVQRQLVLPPSTRNLLDNDYSKIERLTASVDQFMKNSRSANECFNSILSLMSQRVDLAAKVIDSLDPVLTPYKSNDLKVKINQSISKPQSLASQASSSFNSRTSSNSSDMASTMQNISRLNITSTNSRPDNFPALPYRPNRGLPSSNSTRQSNSIDRVNAWEADSSINANDSSMREKKKKKGRKKEVLLAFG